MILGLLPPTKETTTATKVWHYSSLVYILWRRTLLYCRFNTSDIWYFHNALYVDLLKKVKIPALICHPCLTLKFSSLSTSCPFHLIDWWMGQWSNYCWKICRSSTLTIPMVVFMKTTWGFLLYTLLLQPQEGETPAICLHAETLHQRQNEFCFSKTYSPLSSCWSVSLRPVYEAPEQSRTLNRMTPDSYSGVQITGQWQDSVE